MDYTSLVLSQCRNISWKVQTARAMRKRCRQLGQRVRSVEELVQALQQRTSGSMSPQVGLALQRLYTTLMSADDLIQKCIDNRVVNSLKYKSDFNALDRLIVDSQRVLATVPHMDQAPSTSRAPQEYLVEEVDDDSDEDLGILMPYALGGAVAPVAAQRLQPSVTCETVVLVENGSVIYAERISGHF